MKSIEPYCAYRYDDRDSLYRTNPDTFDFVYLGDVSYSCYRDAPKYGCNIPVMIFNYAGDCRFFRNDGYITTWIIADMSYIGDLPYDCSEMISLAKVLML